MFTDPALARVGMNESEAHREGSRIQIDNRTCGIAPTAPGQTTNLVLQLRAMSG